MNKDTFQNVSLPQVGLVEVRRPLALAQLDEFTMYDLAVFENTTVIHAADEIAHIRDEYFPHLSPGLLTHVFVVSEIYRELAWRLQELRNDLLDQQYEMDIAT